MEKFLDKQYPNPDRLPRLRHFLLGFTVAAEHFTAVWAENILKRPAVQAMMYDAEIRNLLNWHALEELEHKSVAFDVYRAVGVPESTRIRWMRFAQNCGIPILVLFAWLSIATTDVEGRRPSRSGTFTPTRSTPPNSSRTGSRNSSGRKVSRPTT